MHIWACARLESILHPKKDVPIYTNNSSTDEKSHAKTSQHQFETRFDALPCPGRGEFDGPQRTWGGAFDRNTRGVGNLIRCLDFVFVRINASFELIKLHVYANVKKFHRTNDEIKEWNISQEIDGLLL